MTYLTNILSLRQSTSIKQQECKLCAVQTRKKIQIFVVRHTAPYLALNSSAVLLSVENLLSL